MTQGEIEMYLRDAALRHILKCDVSKEARYEAEHLFANEIDIFVAGARCAFKMIVDRKLTEKEDKK